MMYALGSTASTLAGRAAELRPVFVRVGDAEGVPWGLLMGIAQVESGFRADVVNEGTGAAGLMQIMSAYPHRDIHFRGLGWRYPDRFERVSAGVLRGIGGSGWNDPAANIRAGARILLDQMRWRGQDLRRALSGYGGHSGAPPDVPYVDTVLAAAATYGFRPHASVATAAPATPTPTVQPALATIAPVGMPIIRDAPMPERAYQLIPAVTTAAPYLLLAALLGAALRARR